VELRAIKTVAVEQWLKTLVTTKFGKAKPLPAERGKKIRDAMSSIFNHAIPVGTDRPEPITGPTKRSGVRVSARENVHLTFSNSKRCNCFLRLLVSGEGHAVSRHASGLRRGELAGLKWEDFDFKKLHVSVTRSLVDSTWAQ